MIPAFDNRGLLPAGIHDASGWDEVLDRLGFNPRREILVTQIRLFVTHELGALGTGLELCIGGSFLTDKHNPGDIDCTIVVPVSEFARRIPLLQLAAQHGGKGRIWTQYEVEFYPTFTDTANANDFRDYFQYVGTKTGALKGLPSNDRRGIVKVAQWHLG
jgi:hypothetical protein